MITRDSLQIRHDKIDNEYSNLCEQLCHLLINSKESNFIRIKCHHLWGQMILLIELMQEIK